MQILRLDKTAALAGYRSGASIYQLARAGLWTRPVHINVRSSGWPESEVRALIAARVAGQSEQQIRELVKALHERRAGALAEALAA